MAIGAAIGGQFQLGLAGGGASSTNVINGNTLADLQTNATTLSGALDIQSATTDTITAQVQAIAGAGSGSASGSGGAVSIGAAIANNSIGSSGSPAITRASINGANGSSGINSLQSGGSLTLKATNNGTIDATVGATAAAVAWSSGEWEWLPAEQGPLQLILEIPALRLS